MTCFSKTSKSCGSIFQIYLGVICSSLFSLVLKLKGTPTEEISAMVEDMIKILGMEAKADYAAGNLSGGQKRKLSVGIAIIGDSKVCAIYTLCSRNKK